MHSKLFAPFFFLLFSFSSFSQIPKRFDNKIDIFTICPDCVFDKYDDEKKIIVQLKKGTDPSAIIKDIKAKCGIELKMNQALAPKYDIYSFKKINHSNSPLALVYFQNLPSVISAEWDAPVEFRDTFPNDTRWAENWSFNHIGLPEVWDLSTGGQTTDGDEIVVAILDSGFDLSHNDLQGNIWENHPEVNGTMGVDDDGNGLIDDFHGWNYKTDSNNLLPDGVNGHGTSVAGIIGGKGNNSMGITGINWDVKMMFFRIEEKSDVVAAFNYIIDQRELYQNTNGAEGAFVVVTNTSFGIQASPCENSPAWAAMYDLLGQSGILNIGATANENWDVDEFGDMPTSCPSDFLVTVTATTQEDERKSNAAFGLTSIDLGAPGDSITTTRLNQNYNPEFGSTSAACPHVAGTVALLYSLPCPDLIDLAKTDPPAAALLMKDALLQNVDPISDLKGKTTTGGRLNAFESMKHIHSWCIGLEEDRNADQVKGVYLDRRALLRVFPNPSSDKVTVHFAALDFEKLVSFRVVNVLGQEMYTPAKGLAQPFEKQQFDIDISDWPSGMYVVNILDNTLKLSLPFLKI